MSPSTCHILYLILEHCTATRRKAVGKYVIFHNSTVPGSTRFSLVGAPAVIVGIIVATDTLNAEAYSSTLGPSSYVETQPTLPTW